MRQILLWVWLVIAIIVVVVCLELQFLWHSQPERAVAVRAGEVLSALVMIYAALRRGLIWLWLAPVVIYLGLFAWQGQGIGLEAILLVATIAVSGISAVLFRRPH